ncbi:MAG: tRNA (cytidine(56)-2'-O)-methyltransferase [Nitrososphaerales archaeon]
MTRIVVLRWGHRLRDERLTSHLLLTARAFGCSGIIVSEVNDWDILETMTKLVRDWGGPLTIEMGVSWKKAVTEWKRKGGIIVHLTAYGENIQRGDVMTRIRKAKKDILILVGSQKVPAEFMKSEVSDFNVSIGNQPHSEVAALAVFLDRFYKGSELQKKFHEPRRRISPNPREKIVLKLGEHLNSPKS